MAIEVLFHPLAEEDLVALYDHIAQDSPANAIAFVRRLRDHCMRLIRGCCGTAGGPTLFCVGDTGPPREEVLMPVVTPERMIEETTDDGPCGPSRMLRIGEAGGLTQFGAFVEILPPGSRSSIKHWHSAEDEMVYVLEGTVTLIEGDTETPLRPGDAATFRAGDPVGHCLHNRSDAPTRCLVVGTRVPVDTVTYPDEDRVCHRDADLHHVWTDGRGNPASSPYG